MTEFYRCEERIDLDRVPALVVDYRGAGFYTMAEEWDAFYTEAAQIVAMRDALGITETTYIQAPAPDGAWWEMREADHE